MDEYNSPKVSPNVSKKITRETHYKLLLQAITDKLTNFHRYLMKLSYQDELMCVFK